MADPVSKQVISAPAVIVRNAVHEGAINIIGSSYARRFNTVRSLELRVGALPLYAGNSMKYYLSWSTAGLINEHCQLAEALYSCTMDAASRPCRWRDSSG